MLTAKLMDMRMGMSHFFLFFFFFLVVVGVGPYACYVGALPFDPYTQSFLNWLFCDRVTSFLAGSTWTAILPFMLPM
jgi:hypothetical protein